VTDRRWKVVVDKTSSAVSMEPTVWDQMKERQLERARLNRAERRDCDPAGLGIYGVEETIDEVVRRQNQR
jgi:hypothetical protein